MPYCENCGKLVSPNAKFCSGCGAAVNNLQQPVQPVQPPPPPQEFYQQPNTNYQQPQAAFQPQAPVQQAQERVLGAIPMRKMKSLGRCDNWIVVFTVSKTIFAQVTNQITKDAAEQARVQSKAEGKGFFGQWGDQLKATFGLAQRYLGMEPNAVLTETPGNFAVDNSGIREVKLHTKDDIRGGQYYR